MPEKMSGNAPDPGFPAPLHTAAGNPAGNRKILHLWTGHAPFVVYDGIARKKNITWWPLGPAGTVMSFLYLSYSYVVW